MLILLFCTLIIQERAERRGRPVTNSDAEIRTLQQELADKNKVNIFWNTLKQM